MRIRRVLAIVASGLMVAGGLSFVAAPAASANQTWVQSFQRSGPDAPCTAPAGLDIVWQEGWTGSPNWTPSWEQWPNNEQGGWTCTRSITWAKDGQPPFPSGACIQGSPDEWVQFNGGWSLPVGSPDYDDAACTTASTTIIYDIVYAPSGWDAAALCVQAFGTAQDFGNFGYPVYTCKGYE